MENFIMIQIQLVNIYCTIMVDVILHQSLYSFDQWILYFGLMVDLLECSRMDHLKTFEMI